MADPGIESTPRQLVDQKLAELRTTPSDFARKHQIAFGILHDVIQGNYPSDPVALHQIGKAIDAEPKAWAEAMAAGLARITRDDARTSLRGLLWCYLVLQGLSIPACAAKFLLPERALRLALSSGRISDRIRQSPHLLEAIGQPIEDLGVHAVSKMLAEMFQRAYASDKALSANVIAANSGVAPKTIAKLKEGRVPKVLHPAVVPRLAKCLKVEPDHLARVLATHWRTNHSNAGTLKFLVVRHCFTHGIPYEAFGRDVGITMERVRDVLSGRIPESEPLEAIRLKLNVPAREWERAVREQQIRAIADSRTYQSLINVEPLNEMIMNAADAAGVETDTWASDLGIGHKYIAKILRKGVIPKREEIRVALIRGLGIDRVVFDAACRKMGTHFRDELSFSNVVGRTGIQEQILRLVREQGVSINKIAHDIGVSRRTLITIAKYGAFNMRPDTQEHLRRWLKLSPDAFQRHIEPVGEDMELVDDEELRLVANFRRMAPKRQANLLRYSGKLLAEPRPMTLSYADGKE